MRLDLSGKTALITGAGRGIGAGIADVFEKAGARVVRADIHGGTDFRLDVTKEEDWKSAIDTLVEHHDGLDILVNNAGVMFGEAIEDLGPNSLDLLPAVNIRGVQLGMKYAFLAMQPGGQFGKGGVILNLSSTAAYMSAPGFSAYCASKAAVERLTKVAAMEAGRAHYNIRINCIYPGNIDTAMASSLAQEIVAGGGAPTEDAARDILRKAAALERLGTVEDVGKAALFLCSDASGFITGAGLTVDGGTGLV
ncbi:SDR family oxidoreductase [Congregibacter sp.]|jgi:3alpha(or 20beta)-hydroxysteroid dehydrogenase|uniref:SDR family oxidoreductase n=1 Tax=Congregibacter sp. TaxID=2744308 RepID=UPI0039E485B6